MKSCQRKRSKKNLTFSYAVRSFVGFLEGTQKAAQSVKSYRSDLNGFQSFLEKGLGKRPVSLASVTLDDLRRYSDSLRAQGLKINTRRRKLLTVRRLLKYLTQRKQLSVDLGKRLPAPHKMERVPIVVKTSELLRAIRDLPRDGTLRLRNQTLLWILAESGCLVSELPKIKFSDCCVKQGRHQITVNGKSAREIPISAGLFETIQKLRSETQGSAGGSDSYLFHGFNKFGSLGTPITPRGIELLVKAHAPALGLDELTPRTFRHSAVLMWFELGKTREDIQKLLGLKTAYAFRAYEPLLKSIASSTSTS